MEIKSRDDENQNSARRRRRAGLGAAALALWNSAHDAMSRLSLGIVDDALVHQAGLANRRDHVRLGDGAQRLLQHDPDDAVVLKAVEEVFDLPKLTRPFDADDA